jgi:hypothetical protein
MYADYVVTGFAISHEVINAALTTTIGLIKILVDSLKGLYEGFKNSASAAAAAGDVFAKIMSRDFGGAAASAATAFVGLESQFSETLTRLTENADKAQKLVVGKAKTTFSNVKDLFLGGISSISKDWDDLLNKLLDPYEKFERNKGAGAKPPRPEVPETSEEPSVTAAKLKTEEARINASYEQRKIDLETYLSQKKALIEADFQVELVTLARRQRNLGVYDRLAQRLHGVGRVPQVDAEIAADIIERDSEQQVINVVAAEMRVAIGGDDLENAFVQLEN